MTAALTTVKWTVEDYHRMIDAGILTDVKAELLWGEVVEMAPEGKPHAHLSSNGADYIREQLAGEVKVREAKPITLADDSEPEPDIAVVQDLGDAYLEHHPFAENVFWLVEYADASLKKDLESKPLLYAEVGIPEYWVVNLRRMELVVFTQPENGRYQRQKRLIEGQVSPVMFPQISLAVNRFIRR
ncbi:MAG: Uma2 family endonuclease [Almyronema sp.]